MIKKSPYLPDYRYLRDIIFKNLIYSDGEFQRDAVGMIVKRGILWIKWLRDWGCDIISSDYIFRMASRYGHLDIVKYMVKNGVDIHIQNDGAFKWASEKGHLNIMKYLLKKGVDIKNVHDYLIHASTRNGHLESIKYLFEISDAIYNPKYLEHIALESTHLNIIKYFIEKNPGQFDIYKGIDHASSHGQVDIIEYLCNKIIDKKTIEYLYQEALLISTGSGKLNVVKYLVEKGLDINRLGALPFRNAIEGGHIDIVKYITKKEKHNHPDNYRSLIDAEKRGHSDVVAYLKDIWNIHP